MTELIRATVSRKILPFSIADIESECIGISRDMIRHVLRQMRDEGIVVTTGAGRSVKWKKMDC